jgi:hypothetical protein
MLKHSLFAAAAVLMLASPAPATTIFGSKLTHEPTPPETCRAGSRPFDLCSWVMTIAQGFPGHERAPKTGIIARVSLRSCTPGSFVLQLTRANFTTKQARATRTGPAINYKGSAVNCNGGNFIETFNVSIPVTVGDSLSVVATRVGFIYNASGDGTLVYDPLLPDGGPFRTTTTAGFGSGQLLLEAFYND